MLFVKDKVKCILPCPREHILPLPFTKHHRLAFTDCPSRAAFHLAIHKQHFTFPRALSFINYKCPQFFKLLLLAKKGNPPSYPKRILHPPFFHVMHPLSFTYCTPFPSRITPPFLHVFTPLLSRIAPPFFHVMHPLSFT